MPNPLLDGPADGLAAPANGDGDGDKKSLPKGVLKKRFSDRSRCINDHHKYHFQVDPTRFSTFTYYSPARHPAFLVHYVVTATLPTFGIVLNYHHRDNVSSVHNAIVHGRTVKDNVLIGMDAIVMDDYVVEGTIIIAAGAVVTRGDPCGVRFDPCGGCPLKRLRKTSEGMTSGEIQRFANSSIKYAGWYKD